MDRRPNVLGRLFDLFDFAQASCACPTSRLLVLSTVTRQFRVRSYLGRKL